MRLLSSSLWAALSLTALLAGCRGQESDQPPVHLNPNMDSQPRYDSQAESKFFEDRRTMRFPVEGTVAKGNFLENDVYATGKDGDQYVAKMPVPITESMLKRGQQQYNIYCTPCHDATGSGMGLVVTRGGYPQATNLNEAYSRTMPDGQIYGAIAYGIRNMPSYAAQIPVEDRWAVVAYVRALQFSQNASIQDVPADKRGGMPVEAAK
ncbi:MAG: cytochrome c [Polyangiaceae bacterium]|jgi:mono/diheme cytochrome c family protein|nr:cytochrome c [Polyangiaceae bacterium]